MALLQGRTERAVKLLAAGMLAVAGVAVGVYAGDVLEHYGWAAILAAVVVLVTVLWALVTGRRRTR